MTKEEFLKQSEEALDTIIESIKKLKGKPIQYLTFHAKTYDEPGEKGKTTIGLLSSGEEHPVVAAFRTCVISAHENNDKVSISKLMNFIKQSSRAIEPSKKSSKKLNTVLDELLELLGEEPENNDESTETKTCQCGKCS